jgi:hypothetical protein
VKGGTPIFLSIGFIVNPILIILMFVVLLDWKSRTCPELDSGKKFSKNVKRC